MKLSEKTAAEVRLSDIFYNYVSRTSARWRGYERVLLVELVRALDESTFALTLAMNRDELRSRDFVRHSIVHGAAAGLRPFLQNVQNTPGGVPWGPTTPELSLFADTYLKNCGKLSNVQRIASFERYGLAKSHFVSSNHLVIEVLSAEDEREDVESALWLLDYDRNKQIDEEIRHAQNAEYVKAKIDQYVEVSNEWFIQYSPDWESMKYFRRCAELKSAGTAEANAFAVNASFGDWSYGNWMSCALDAYGRILHHVACATSLRARHDDLVLRNLLTVFARKEDIFNVWLESGLEPSFATEVIKSFTLDFEAAADAECRYDIPVPYYIDFGRDFVLLPMFGGLLNSHASVLSYLKKNYRADWDRAVGARENIFRSELQDLFSSPRYVVPDTGFQLRRNDGSVLTDIDAVVLDQERGVLVLVQLKWHDIYSRSLKERASRKTNLEKANEWVDRVHSWIGDRSSRTIAKEWNLSGAGDCAPFILVVARHASRFVDFVDRNEKACWISWPRLVRLVSQSSSGSVVDIINDETLMGDESSKSEHLKTKVQYSFPDLLVDVHLS